MNGPVIDYHQQNALSLSLSLSLSLNKIDTQEESLWIYLSINYTTIIT